MYLATTPAANDYLTDDAEGPGLQAGAEDGAERRRLTAGGRVLDRPGQ
jgi:hypothetical protein